MTNDTYACACCHQTFTRVLTEEETAAECKKEFGVTPDEVPCDVVCDDCYQQLQAWLQATQRSN